MGQKVHPTGFRLGVVKKHNANWYAKGKTFKENLIEDLKVRDFLKNKLRFSSVSKVEIDRSAQNFTVSIHTSRPGIIIGKKGEEIENIKKSILFLTPYMMLQGLGVGGKVRGRKFFLFW